MLHTFEIEPTALLSKSLCLMSVGSTQSQTSLTCVSSALWYGSCCKASKCSQKWRLNPNVECWLAMMMGQNQSFTTTQKLEKYLSPGTFISLSPQLLSPSIYLSCLIMKGS